MNAARRLIEHDARLCIRANRWSRSPSVLQVFSLISRLGDGWIWYALMLALPLAFGGEGIRASLHMAVTGLIALGMYRAMKDGFRRPRPFRSHDGVTVRIAPLDEFSFPSGHTLHAVAFSIIAIWHFPILAGLLLPLSLMIAASRVILGLHYPSDVLAAAVIATLLSMAMIALWPLA